MENSEIVRLGDNAYFVVDSFSFYSSLVGAYDPMIANQTILFDWDTSSATQSPQQLTAEYQEDQTVAAPPSIAQVID
jgi:hypothetical protein